VLRSVLSVVGCPDITDDAYSGERFNNVLFASLEYTSSMRLGTAFTHGLTGLQKLLVLPSDDPTAMVPISRISDHRGHNGRLQMVLLDNSRRKWEPFHVPTHMEPGCWRMHVVWTEEMLGCPWGRRSNATKHSTTSAIWTGYSRLVITFQTHTQYEI